MLRNLITRLTYLHYTEAAQQEWEKNNDKGNHERVAAEMIEVDDRPPSMQTSEMIPQRRLAPTQSLSAFLSGRRSALKRWWRSAEVYRLRIRLDGRIQSFKHSRHLKHTFKCAFGISLLTLPGHLPASNAGGY